MLRNGQEGGDQDMIAKYSFIIICVVIIASQLCWSCDLVLLVTVVSKIKYDDDDEMQFHSQNSQHTDEVY